MNPRKHEALDVLESHFPEVIATMKQCFNTHDFLKELSRRHQHEYIRALYAVLDGPYPFQNIHKAIAQRLGASGLVRNIGTDHNSFDIFGQRNSATEWEKL
jgi:hypothetical protein